MKFEVNVNKPGFLILIGLILVFAGVFVAHAYNTGFSNDNTKPPVFGHSADEVNVKMTDGSLKTVQQLLSAVVAPNTYATLEVTVPIPPSGTDDDAVIALGSHGLSSKPILEGAWIECVSPDNGYSAGDRLGLSSVQTNANAPAHTVRILADKSVAIITNLDNSEYWLPRKSDGFLVANGLGWDRSKWKFVVVLREP